MDKRSGLQPWDRVSQASARQGLLDCMQPPQHHLFSLKEVGWMVGGEMVGEGVLVIIRWLWRGCGRWVLVEVIVSWLWSVV